MGENGLIEDEFAATKACKDIRGGFLPIFQKHKSLKIGLARYCYTGVVIQAQLVRYWGLSHYFNHRAGIK